MKRMNEVFDLNEPIGYPTWWSDEQVRMVGKAIKNIDALADALYGLLAVIDKRDLGKYGLKSYESAELALNTYRGAK